MQNKDAPRDACHTSSSSTLVAGRWSISRIGAWQHYLERQVFDVDLEEILVIIVIVIIPLGLLGTLLQLLCLL